MTTPQISPETVDAVLNAAVLDITSIHERIGERGLLNQTALIQNLCRNALVQIERARKLCDNILARQARDGWQPKETAPRDDTTFWAMQWCDTVEDSAHWALHFEDGAFKCVETGKVNTIFTHWMPVSPHSRPTLCGDGK